MCWKWDTSVYDSNPFAAKTRIYNAVSRNSELKLLPLAVPIKKDESSLFPLASSPCFPMETTPRSLLQNMCHHKLQGDIDVPKPWAEVYTCLHQWEINVDGTNNKKALRRRERMSDHLIARISYWKTVLGVCRRNCAHFQLCWLCWQVNCPSHSQ